MAKDQDLPLNPLRISGACGRLMCCLKYEHPLYQSGSNYPTTGARVEVGGEQGRVVSRHQPSETVTVRMADGGGVRRCALSEVCGSRRAYEER
jgi:cell fate regulator YaaT (PSP1 superfamily)